MMTKKIDDPTVYQIVVPADAPIYQLFTGKVVKVDPVKEHLYPDGYTIIIESDKPNEPTES